MNQTPDILSTHLYDDRKKNIAVSGEKSKLIFVAAFEISVQAADGD